MVPPDAIDPLASAPPASPAGSDLCRDCGLCCDGSLFYGVDLAGEEVEAAAANGLDPIVEDGAAQFRQPCPRFCGVCGIYPDRPLRCRAYRCELLKRLERGQVEVESAYAIVAEAQRLAGAADAVALPGEGRGAARQRWERALRAMTGDRAESRADTQADPRWLLAMTAFNYYLDRHFRKPRRHRVALAHKPETMSGEG